MIRVRLCRGYQDNGYQCPCYHRTGLWYSPLAFPPLVEAYPGGTCSLVRTVQKETTRAAELRHIGEKAHKRQLKYKRCGTNHSLIIFVRVVAIACTVRS